MTTRDHPARLIVAVILRDMAAYLFLFLPVLLGLFVGVLVRLAGLIWSGCVWFAAAFVTGYQRGSRLW